MQRRKPEGRKGKSIFISRQNVQNEINDIVAAVVICDDSLSEIHLIIIHLIQLQMVIK